MGINRKNIYYQNKHEQQDDEVKNQIESVQVANPAYGHRRIAWELKMNHKKILRVMHKYGLKPLRRKIKFFKKADLGRKDIVYENILKRLCPIVPGVVWVSDFTYIKYQGRFIYMATIEDYFTREVLGIAISRFHNTNLVLDALHDALTKGRAAYIHSDQGSEYQAGKYLEVLEEENIKVSYSDKGSPWQNGQMESFFGRFKEESGDLNRFESLPELIEYIYQQIYYYNNKRIHTKFRTSPIKFKQTFSESRHDKWGT